MRITNKMMSNNSLYNINNNKEYLDKLNTQMATEKKITRPSDDPIVAIRALRLRSNLSEVTQYYGANVPDAQAWVSVTQKAIDSTMDMLSTMRSLCDQGANGTNTASDRDKIYQTLEAYKNQIYSNGNVTNAGRSVFTGYRTGEKLTFTEDTEAYYKDIADTFNAKDISIESYVKTPLDMDKINAVSSTAKTAVETNYAETQVEEEKVYRIRMSYDKLEADADGNVKLKYKEPLADADVRVIKSIVKDNVTGIISQIELADSTGTVKETLTSTDGFKPENTYTVTGGSLAVHTDGSMTYTATGSPEKVYNISANGKTITSAYKETTVTVEAVKSTDGVGGTTKTAYETLKLNDANKSDTSVEESAYLLTDTGELVMGSALATKLSELKDITGVDTISVTYNKTSFNSGDLRPEHYFDCKLDVNGDGYKTGTADILYDCHDQEIYYTVGTNQNIQINTHAGDVFDTQITRELDDIMKAIQEYNVTEEKVNKLKAMQEDTITYNTEDQQKISIMLDAANKELDLAKNKLQSKYENGITAFKKFYEQSNLANTNCGTIDSRLTLISNRLMEEKSTVTTLASENENVDITNIAVEVSEAELVYNAALMATGKINQRSLIDYI